VANSCVYPRPLLVNFVLPCPRNTLHPGTTTPSITACLQVIVWMCNPATTFNYTHPKVRIITDYTANDKFGLSTRFKGCLMARSPWVLIQDDDHYAKVGWPWAPMTTHQVVAWP
jgi:hypothetical protein